MAKGRGGYREEDELHPVNKYAWSKLGGECAVRLYDRSLIVRTSFGPDVFPYERAFVDQWTSRESVSVVARKLVELVDSERTGVVHVGGPRRTGARIRQESRSDTPDRRALDRRRAVRGSLGYVARLRAFRERLALRARSPRVKLLVAGGAGYIGSRLVPVLLDHGYEVHVIDLLWFGRHLPDGVEVIEKDLFECKTEDLEGYDQVIFLAGLSNDPMAEFDPSMNFTYNAALPSYLAFIAKQAGVRRFIYGSTCSVYGYTVDELYDEEGPVTCRAPYGISKLQGERGVLQLGDETFSTIALRQGTVCGWSPRHAARPHRQYDGPSGIGPSGGSV